MIRRYFRILKNRLKKSVSQEQQDTWLMQNIFHHRKNGRFLDLGCADGIYLSNTFLMEYRYGWKGACIDGNPALARECSLNRKCQVFHAILGAQDGLPCRYGVHALTSQILSSPTKANESKYEKIISGHTRNLENLLHENGIKTHFDYVSVDLEGHEEEILSGLHWDSWEIKAMTIERPTTALQKILKENKFRPVFFIKDLDTFFVHESVSQ